MFVSSIAMWLVLLGCLSVAAHGTHTPTTFDHGLDSPITTTRPLVIGHRGASGVLPEHTRRAYEQAIADGADVIECDVVVTSDAALVCRHDPWLESNTNIADHPEFASRKRTIIDFEYYGTLRNLTDWFVKDFTLAELQTLSVKQTNSERDPSHDYKYPIVTLDEFIQIAKTGKVGVSIELKYPKWVNSLGLFNTSFEEVFLEQLKSHGYSESTDPCLLQTFELTSTEVLANLTDLPVMMAIEYEYQATEDLLKVYKKIGSYGVITWKCSVADHYGPTGGYKNWIRNFTDVVERIHQHGMKVHLYTFRNEQSNLAWDYAQDPWREYDAFMALDVDGYYTDFPATLTRYLDARYPETPDAPVPVPCSAPVSPRAGWRSVGVLTLMGLLLGLRM